MAFTNSLIPANVRPYMAGTAGFISIVPVVAGLTAVLRPQIGLRMLGFPRPTSPKDQRLVDGLVQMYGCRQLATGLTAITMWYLGSHRTLGFALIISSIVAGVDGWATKHVLGDGEWNHWGALPVGLGLGFGLTGLL